VTADLGADRLALTEPAGLAYKRLPLSAADPENQVFWLESEGFGAWSGGPVPRRPDKRRTPREADLSTEQAGAQAPSWFPDPDGYQGWPEGAQCPPGARPEAAQRL